jgi:DNA-binding transcriptional LysR family regulator
MNFNQLRAFHEVAKTLSFSAAARNLHVSQPAVTAHVKALEDTLGVKLFRKRGRRVVVSETGALLFRHAHEVFELEKRMERTIEEVRHLERGLLKIGTTKTYARHLMPPLMTHFHATFPNVRMVLDEGSSQEMCRSLLDLRNELAVVARVGECRGITFVPFRREAVALFASATHPLTHRKGIRFRELAEQLVIMREEGSGIQDLVRRCFEKRGLVPNVLVETSNVEFIRDMVERGDAVSFLVRSAMAEDLERGGIKEIPVVDEDLALEVNIAYLDDPHLSPAAAAFLELLQQEGTDPSVNSTDTIAEAGRLLKSDASPPGRDGQA